MHHKSLPNLVAHPVFWWIVVVILGVLSRFYLLGVMPVGLTWDEAAIAYNGWSVWSTFRDEWLQLLPISFQSFGDYKAPLAMYIVGPLMMLGGPVPFLIRLPFALAGVVTILASGWLVWELRKLYTPFAKNSVWWALFASFLVVASPWHHHFSRVGFESGLALCAVTLGMALFIRWVRFSQEAGHTKTSSSSLTLLATLLLSVGFFATSFYAYHSAKIVVPLLALLCISVWHSTLWRNVRVVLAAVVVGCMLLVPFAYDSLYRSGAERFNQVTVFNNDEPFANNLLTMASQYAAHWSPQFLVLGATDSLRHGTGTTGILFFTDFSLFIAALVLFALAYAPIPALASQRQRTESVIPVISFGLLWIMIGFVPPALGMDGIPHANRALLALPGFIILLTGSAEAALQLIKASTYNQKIQGSHGEKDIVLKAIVGMWALLHVVFFITYLHTYYTSYRVASSGAYQSGYQELMERMQTLEKEREWEKILISSQYGQPYIYTLLFHRYSPYQYHGGVLINYEFAQIKAGDVLRKNALIVATPEDPVAAELPQPPDITIKDDAGVERFWIYVRP